MDDSLPPPPNPLVPAQDAAESGEDWVPPSLLNAGPKPQPLIEDPATLGALEALQLGTLEEVHERLLDGDPLGLADIVREGLDELCVLIDAQRLLDRVVARCAWASQRDPLEPSRPLRQWVGARVMEALEEINEEDWSEERLELPVDPYDDRYQGLVLGSALDPNQARRVALLFNQLKASVRLPLYALLVKGRAMTDVAAEHHMTRDELRELVVRHLTAFSMGPRPMPGIPSEEAGA